MNSFSAVLLVYFPVTLVCAFLAAGRSWERRVQIMSVVVAAWLIFAPLTAAMHSWLPYMGAGGEDDKDYFILARIPVDSIGDFFDISRFLELSDQPGYPWFLSAFQPFAGGDLLAYKLSNVCLLILTGLVWTCIAERLESPRFGLVAGLAVFCLTPLWFYTFFLLKDMMIVFLQSLFLLCVVRYWQKPSFWMIVSMGLLSCATLAFRSALVAQQAFVLAGTIILKTFARGGLDPGRMYSVVLAGGFAIVVLAAASNPELTMLFGVVQEGRALDVNSSLEMGKSLNANAYGPLGFSVMYLLTEISGLSSQSWELLDSSWLRGILALPWIICVVPFIPFGIARMVQPMSRSVRGGGWLSGLRDSRMIASPWCALVVFVVSSAAVSWVVGNTTRWRLSDMPPLLMIALAGWLWMDNRLRWLVLMGWLFGVGLAWSSYYLLKTL